MDIPTRNLSKYVKDRRINLSQMSRAINIPYISLYDSLMNDARDRDLRVGEFFSICQYLKIPAETFSGDAKDGVD